MTDTHTLSNVKPHGEGNLPVLDLPLIPSPKLSIQDRGVGRVWQ